MYIKYSFKIASIGLVILAIYLVSYWLSQYGFTNSFIEFILKDSTYKVINVLIFAFIFWFPIGVTSITDWQADACETINSTSTAISYVWLIRFIESFCDKKIASEWDNLVEMQSNRTFIHISFMCNKVLESINSWEMHKNYALHVHMINWFASKIFIPLSWVMLLDKEYVEHIKTVKELMNDKKVTVQSVDSKDAIKVAQDLINN